MKIIRNDKKGFVAFDDLMYYDIFLTEQDYVCLKIPRVIGMEDEEEYNAIDMKNNEFLTFEHYEKVKKLNCELIVRD